MLTWSQKCGITPPTPTPWLIQWESTTGLSKCIFSSLVLFSHSLIFLPTALQACLLFSPPSYYFRLLTSRLHSACLSCSFYAWTYSSLLRLTRGQTSQCSRCSWRSAPAEPNSVVSLAWHETECFSMEHNRAQQDFRALWSSRGISHSLSQGSPIAQHCYCSVANI